MPIVTVDSEDLKSMVGRKIPDSELRRVLPLNKLGIEDWTGTELKIEITPDRPDLFSAEGMARQIESWLGITPGPGKFPVSPPKIELKPSKVSLRPFITCGIVRNLRMTSDLIKSIMQLQEMLDLTIGRDRKKVAIGLHDISKVSQPFFYKEVSPESVSFVPLNSTKKMNLKEIIKTHTKGIQYAHLVRGPRWPVILDSRNQALSFPPIINGELTKVTEETTDIFFEITGSDEKAINHCLNILVTALEKRGGKTEGVRIGSSVKPDLSPRLIRIDTEEAKKLLGLEIKNSELQSLLERMGYGASAKAGKADVLIPAYRADILHPVDIFEDIAIAYGFDNLIPEAPKLPSTGNPAPIEEFSNSMRELMVGLGFQEVMNFTLTTKERQFAKMRLKPLEVAELQNPSSQDHSVCRRWLLPSLLEDCRTNLHRRFPQRIFETADCIIPDSGSDSGFSNARKLSCLSTHAKANLSEILSILNSLRENLGIKWEIHASKNESFIPGRCGSIRLAGAEIGIFGEIHPEVILNFELNNPIAAFELDVQKIFEQVSKP